jgi:hypothetical protein
MPAAPAIMKKEFHHIGIPTTQKQPDDIYLADSKLYITDANQNEHRIEWLRFEPGSPLPDVLRTTPHVAFTVDNLEAALAGRKIIVQPFAPMPGLKVAFILDGAAPVEYLEFAK